MSLRIRQIVLVAHNLESTVANLESVFGVSVAYRDPQVAEFGLHNAVMSIGDQFLEVIAPIQLGTAAGRHLERRGDSAYMIILQTDDLARARTRIERLGVRVIWQANHEDIRAAQLHPKDIGGAIVSLDQSTPPDSWRWAGPDWKKHVSKGARNIRAVAIEAANPEAMSRRWSQVLELEDPVKDRDAYRLDIDGGALNFVATGARGDGIDAFTLTVTAPRTTIAAARARELPTKKESVTICGTKFRLASVV
jgi:hypothetical protein